MNIWAKIVEVNLGRVDRWLRVLLGLGMLVLALAVPANWGFFGFYPLLTGMGGTCPLYKLFGIHTTPAPRVLKVPPAVQA